MSIVDYISNLDRPSYAPSFDGTYFESAILGYRTTGVEGRSSFQSSVAELSSEVRDGALFYRNIRQPREITVKFAITTDSAKELHDSEDKLKGLVTNYRGDPYEKTEFKVIFDDEPDKFYKGVITNFTLEELVNNKNSSGQFTIHCADPFKYSVDIFTAVGIPANDGETATIIVDYDGTMPSYPTLKAHCNGLTGYIGFVNQNGKIIQIGIPEEVDLPEDEEPKTKSEVIFPKEDESETSFGAPAPLASTDFSVKWQVNPLGLGDMTNNLMKVGDNFSATGTAVYGSYISGENVHVPNATSYGNDAFVGWHGPVVSRKELYFEDSNGSHQHKNGTLEFKHSMVTGANDYGEFVATLDRCYEKNGNPVREALAKIVFYKKTKGSNRAACNLMTYSKTALGGKTVDTFTFDSGTTGNVTKESKVNNAGPATHKITKIDDKIIFSINGSQYSYRDPDIKEMTIDGVSFAFAKHTATTPVSKNLLYSAKFTSHSVTDLKDVPNPFGFNDDVVANTSSGQIELNGVWNHGLGALGNDWETFYLSPGRNEIICTCSTSSFYENSQGETSVPIPNYSISYRKVYL